MFSSSTFSCFQHSLSFSPGTEKAENPAEVGSVTDRLDSFEVLSEAFGNDAAGPEFRGLGLRAWATPHADYFNRVACRACRVS